MVIGIKYCGGCNSTYDRAAEVQRLMADFPEHTYIYAQQGTTTADYWLIVCGCPVVCANTDGLVARKDMIVLQAADDFKALRTTLAAAQADPM